MKRFFLLILLLTHTTSIQASIKISSSSKITHHKITPHITHPIPTLIIPIRIFTPSLLDKIITKIKSIIPKPLPSVMILPADKFYCSVSRTGNMMVKQKVNGDGGKREKLVSTVYGFDMYVDGKDLTVSSTITVTGTWEPNNVHLIGTIVKKGDRVLNLGSQSGLQALVMGKIIGPEGRLYIFQPYSFSNSLVTMNINLNNLTHITQIYKLAAWDSNTTSTLAIQYWNTGGSQAIPRAMAITDPNLAYSVDQLQQIQTAKVDDVLPGDILLDFALIDVERMEVGALRGMRDIIGRSDKLVMMVEWQYSNNHWRNKQQTVELLQWMVGKGYRMYRYQGGDAKNCKLGWFRKFGAIEELLDVEFCDVLFFPQTVPLPT